MRKLPKNWISLEAFLYLAGRRERSWCESTPAVLVAKIIRFICGSVENGLLWMISIPMSVVVIAVTVAEVVVVTVRYVSGMKLPERNPDKVYTSKVYTPNIEDIKMPGSNP